MKRYISFLAIGALLSLGLLAGCSGDESDLTTASLTGADDYSQFDFSQTYGGLTDTDEEEAFGDEALKAMMLAEEQEVVDDPMAMDPVVLEMEERSRHMERHEEGERPRFTYLRLRWGMLRGPDDTLRVESPCDVTDWTGELHTDRGIVVVKRLIRFERPMDHVIFPRLNRKTVAFVSHTTCHFDGLVIQIIERPDDADSEYAEPNMLHINTPGFSADFEVAHLGDVDEVFEVDDQGNRFQMTGFSLSDIEICPKGFLSGRYRQVRADRPDTVDHDRPGELYGTYAGAWTTLTGRVRGFLRGGYGVTEDGQRIFIGKYIDRRGRFMGLIRAGWNPADEEHDLADFLGHWRGRRGNMEGVLGGQAHPVEDYPGGFIVGRWTTFCDDEAEDTIQ
jgi:hypothetical protein